jgi:hypothetical protein
VYVLSSDTHAVSEVLRSVSMGGGASTENEGKRIMLPSGVNHWVRLSFTVDSRRPP